jgi:hypothetical protein
MFGRSGFRLLGVVLAIGLLLIGASVAYQVGVNVGSQMVAQGAAPAAAVPYYGHPYGFGFGFGVFGFLGTLLFIFLIFAAIRAFAFAGGRGRGWGGPGRWGGGWSGGPGGGPSGFRGSPWEARAREAFDEWHREAHGDAPKPPNPGSTGQA